VQMIRQHKHMALLNPGSVGMPFEFPMRGQEQHAFRRAEYALVDMTDGKLKVDMRRIPIDFEKLEKVTHASGMPGAAFWLATWDIL